MKEGMHAARHRIGERGNIFAFLVSWKDMLDSLHRVEQTPVFVAPHPPEILARDVRWHMKIGGDDVEVAKFVKEIKVHAHVVSSMDIIRRSFRKALEAHAFHKPMLLLYTDSSPPDVRSTIQLQ